ncbi:ATP-binding cassette domain-containing protein [Maribrevibacterium harenarium]|uniref:ATP-binding cassette domain-containing protein n=1 Tax=Maribrevibacterium harenarium TaxID=2589817 RepID=A0A501X5I0_9GAMM|nr:oligopeptide/dipeptide ABC transporter ATP-binding protein [Maribrevibacterium harenarium]TPE55657.1 ATP-binding cassette domain-containing protein [Maribrevibacterium harenarium]
MTKPLIALQQIEKSFRGKRRGHWFNWLKPSPGQDIHALNGVTLTVHSGETLCLVGETGCGKSTLARVLMGLVEPSAGEVHYRGKRIDQLSEQERMPYRRQMQMVFQNPYASLNPRMTVYQILAEAIKLHHPSYGRQQVQDSINELLTSVGLPLDIQDRLPGEFSGGQRQRIAIARALSVEPEFIVADEPLAALDVSVQAQVLNLLMDKQQERGLTYLFITHDLAVVEHIASRVVVMYLGRICEIASRESLFSQPQHPYTQALLASIPRLDSLDNAPLQLEGEVPPPTSKPSGCSFCQRCPLVNQRCYEEVPRLLPQRNGSMVACHAVEEGRAWK